ncbi:MAG: hypothetical protein AAGD11_20600 [Planctomycetota bacterium]
MEITRDEIKGIEFLDYVTLLESHESSWRTVRIVLFESSSSGQIEDEITVAMNKMATWLDTQASSLLKIRDGGCNAQILVDLWIDADQMETRLPVGFLAACSKADLQVYIIAND